MSDTGNDSAQAGPSFTEREMQILAWAMKSLKSGPPEIDYDKLAGFAGMANPRSAANAWAKVRNKLNAATPDGAPVPTPKKGGAKKGAQKGGDANGDADGVGHGDTPKKTPRKRASKKQEVAGEGSPKKRGRPPKAKKEDVVAVKTETAEEKDAEAPNSINEIKKEDDGNSGASEDGDHEVEEI